MGTDFPNGKRLAIVSTMPTIQTSQAYGVELLRRH
jgi:hypothetical protein